jgi:hypothetical protein
LLNRSPDEEEEEESSPPQSAKKRKSELAEIKKSAPPEKRTKTESESEEKVEEEEEEEDTETARVRICHLCNGKRLHCKFCQARIKLNYHIVPMKLSFSVYFTCKSLGQYL